jgi:GAF domain/PucR C-terminal helix-turn-helix domain
MMPTDQHARRGLDAVLAMGRVLSTTASYEQAVAAMVATVSAVLGVETCGFFLHDPERDELVLQRPGFDAYDEDVFAFFHIPLSRPGPTREVFLTRRPTYVNDALENPNSPWYRGCLLVNARTVLVVPLIVEGRGIGVLSLMNKRSGPFDVPDVDLAMQIAPHLALAIDAAAKHQKLEEQQRQLDRALQVHAELSKAILNAPDVGPVAESLARLLKRPVVLLDAALAVLVWAEPPGVRADRSEIEPALREGLRPLISEPGRTGTRVQIHLSDGQALAVVATRVTAGEHLEGCLAAIEIDEPLDRVDARALDHAATLVAFQLLRERTALEVERRLRAELFQELLSVAHGTERGAMVLLERLGASSVGPWRVARLELLAPESTAGPSGIAFDPGVAASLSAAWSQAGVETPLVPWRTGFACVMPEDAVAGGFMSDVAAGLTHRLSGMGFAHLHYILALGAPVASATDLARSLGQAEDALVLAERLGLLDRMVRFEDLAIERVLLESMDASSTHETFVHQVLGPLLAYDATNNRDLLTTLKSYVAADYSPIVVARRLFIHPNTVHFRLRRIADLLGANWPHGDQRFRVELALRLMDLIEIRARQQARERHTSTASTGWLKPSTT